ncbi:MAG: NAD(P)/FAD-dependent oxidoreductase [Dehalococcoidia bacterium]
MLGQDWMQATSNMTAMTSDVVIIGGGITGTAAAYDLARAGVSVTLVERGTLAAMASGWTLAGVRQSGRHPAELPLATAAVRRWEHLSDELGADVQYRQGGNLRLARTPDEVPIIANLVQEQRAMGLDLTFLPDNEAVRTIAPALGPTVLAASFCPSDGHANPHAVVGAFAAAAERHGATLLTGTTVTQIQLDGRRVRGVETTAGPIATDTVVIAAGVYSGRLCAALGLDLPIQTRHVSVAQTVPLPPLIQQVIGVANADIAGRQEVDGRFRMTPGSQPWQWPSAELAADGIQPPIAELVALLTRAIAILPDLARAGIARVWGGLLDMTPDALPVIERAPELDGLVIAAGFSGHGFCLGPISGRIIADLITRGESSLPIEPFRRSRFSSVVGTAKAELHG